MKTLIKIDPEKKKYRWYAIGIQKTLVYGFAVIHGWGNLKSSFQRWRSISVDSQKEAEMIFVRMLKTRLKKGCRSRPSAIR